jgi:hypothetical protein
MSLRRTISLILGLLLVLVTIPASAFDGSCAMDMDAEAGACSCCGDHNAPVSSESGCTTASASTISCCENVPPSSPPRSLPATRLSGSQVLPVLIASFVLAADRPVVEPLLHIDDMPDVVAAERQHTYLHVSSFLI